MKLSDLVTAVEPFRIPGRDRVFSPQMENADISSVHYRSNDVKPGGLFVALKGQRADGRHFIGDAVSRGARAVVVEGGEKVSTDAAVIYVDNARKALATIAARFYGDPSKTLVLIGITGTNGKTTTSFLLEHILSRLGVQVGVIGTVDFRYAGKSYPNPLTTPESADLQQILSRMAASRVTHVIMEVSSHGVALDRIFGCEFDAGVFTNLSQDHLDFHGSMEDYWWAKKRFFTEHLNAGPKQGHAAAVINTDDPRGLELSSALEGINRITVGTGSRAMLHPVHVTLDQFGIRAGIQTPYGECAFQSGLIGLHNLENILCAAGAGVALGIPLPDIAAGISSFSHVPGRLEPVLNGLKRRVYVDYAHTPDALAKVLQALRRVLTGRLICVFGCGGDRDKTKRPKMGEIAGRLSDFVVVTSDNPRTESPEAIIAEILEGVESVMDRRYLPEDLERGFEEKGFIVEPDREKAIFWGIRLSAEGDTILIAGKGHETYQIIGNRTIHFDDREKAAEAFGRI